MGDAHARRQPVALLQARFGHPMQIAWLRNLLIVFGSLLIEAMPFVALGAAVSAAIEVFVPASSFARMAALPRALQIPPPRSRAWRSRSVSVAPCRSGVGWRARVSHQRRRSRLHARRAHREPGGDRLDVRCVSRPRLAVADGRRPVRARDDRRDVCRLGDRGPRAG